MGQGSERPAAHTQQKLSQLSVHVRVWKNARLFRRHNRHYRPHMQTCKQRMNDARHG